MTRIIRVIANAMPKGETKEIPKENEIILRTQKIAIKTERIEEEGHFLPSVLL